MERLSGLRDEVDSLLTYLEERVSEVEELLDWIDEELGEDVWSRVCGGSTVDCVGSGGGEVDEYG